MPQRVIIVLDPDGKGAEFSKIVHHPTALLQRSELSIVTKDKGTDEGNAIAVLSWTAETKQGQLQLAQAVTTVTLLKGALRALAGKYPDKDDVPLTPEQVKEGALQIIRSVVPAMNRAVQIRDWRSVDMSMQLLARLVDDLNQRAGGPPQ